MRFFYLVAHEQRLEAPLHQRPSTPGLGARDCLPPNDVRNNSDVSSNPANQIPETSKSEIKSASNSDRITSLTKNLDKVANNKISTPVDCKPTVTGEKDEANKTTTTTSTTSSTLTTTSATTTILTTVATNVSSSTTTMTTTTTMCNDSNKQIKSPIKIMKNPDGKYEVLKTPPAPSTDIKSPSPEFSVVNSDGVKLTLKQYSPPQNSDAKKPKVISDVILRCGQVEKDILIQRLQPQQDKDKLTTSNPVLPDKLEKQRRKVTFSVDRPPTSEKTSPTNSSGTVPKTALKKPAEQQDKKQFLQGFQLTAREPSVPNDSKLIPTIRDISVTVNALKSLQKTNAKVEEPLKKDTDEIKKKSNTENAASNANSNTIATNAIAKRNLLGMTANSRTNKTNDPNGRAFNSGVSSNNTNITSGNHAAKMDVYTFPSDPPIVPAGAVKRKCPPGVSIADLKHRKLPQIAQKQEANKRQNVLYNVSVKLSRISTAEHVIPTSKATNLVGDYSGNSSRVSNVKTSTSPSNDTRDFLVDGYGLNIPASLSITLTSPKSSGASGQVEFKDPSDNNRGKVALDKVNPSITLNDRSVDPRVLKALKTGQIRMPATPTKVKPVAATAATTKQTPMTTDHSEIATNQQRTTTFVGKRKREHELSKDILDLSGGKKSMDLHPLRIPQPVTKLNQNKINKITSRDNMQPGSVSDQGQLVTLGNHLYYRAPPGSLTPAAHRINDFPLSSASRTPVYAPCLGSINRSSSDLSSVFPTLSSFYALNQAPNLQQFHMDTARLKLPPRSVAESGATSATSGSGDNSANSNINGVPGKSHLAAQCAPVKPSRSSVAPLAVPINKQQHNSTDKSANVNANRTILGDSSSKPSAFRNNEDHASSDDTLRSNVQKRFALDVESTNNRFLSRNEDAKSTSQVTNETAKDTNAESRKETINPDNSMQQQQRQQQQNREAVSPNIVSSTASPSPPPGNGNSMRNEGSTSQNDNNINSSNGDNNGTSPSPTKSIVSEATCNKSPDSPDSSSITVESSSGTSSSKTTDREMSTDVTKTSDANPTTVDDSTAPDNDKNKFAIKSEASEIAKQLTSVQKTLLAVFPSNEWANNPIAAEHLGNFLKSLNATIKNEGSTDESKTEKTDRKTESSETR